MLRLYVNLIAAVMLGMLCLTGCGGEAESDKPKADQPPDVAEADKGPWGETVDGLRCRISVVEVLDQTDDGFTPYRVWAEIENTAEEPRWLLIGRNKDSEGNTLTGDGTGVGVYYLMPDMNRSGASLSFVEEIGQVQIAAGETFVYSTTEYFKSFDLPAPELIMDFYRRGFRSGGYAIDASTIQE